MKRSLISLLCLVPFAAVQSATYIIDFEGDINDTPLSDLGWSQSPTNGQDPLAFVSNDFNDGSGNAAFIGGYYDVPTLSALTVGRDFAGLDLNATLLSFDLAIVDSENGYPDRDTFGFAVRDGSGNPLLTVDLVPVSQTSNPDGDSNAVWRLRYTFGGASTVITNYGITENDSENFSLQTTASGVWFYFNSVDGPQSIFGSPLDYDPNSGSLGLDFTWKTGPVSDDWGSNFMIVDNIVVVPEPSVLLLAGFGGLAMFRRRRV